MLVFNLCGKRILSSRSVYCNLKTPCRSGYIVLVPEFPQEFPNNLSLNTDGLPEISHLTTDQCVSAIGKCTLDYESEIWKMEGNLKGLEPGELFSELLDPLDKLSGPLDNTWGLIKTLYLAHKRVMPAKCYMGIHERARRARAIKFNSPAIYAACKEASDMGDANWTEEQRRVVAKFLLEGRLNGLELQGDSRLKLVETLNKMASERAKFKNKVEVATGRFKHVITDPNMVRDIPQELLRKMAVNSSEYTEGPWTVTLGPDILPPFLEFCGERNLRWNAWQANVRRASGHDDSSLRNSTHIEELRYLRRCQAELLGFPTFAHMSMETKMAGSTEAVRAMVSSLQAKAGAAQETELADLTKFAEERGFQGSLQLWDVPYWKRKQQRTQLSLDETQLRNYFPLPRVLSGLLALCEELFGLQLVQVPQVDSWHPEVLYFNILEAGSEGPVAGLYLDLYSREEDKVSVQGGDGWMVAMHSGGQFSEHHPLAALIFNLPRPVSGKPSLLSFGEVLQLFQKFGHALQHLLTKASYSEVAGMSNIEWDAVEICSHFMGHWLYTRSVMESISEQLPPGTLDKLCLLRQHMAGYELSRELYLASLDLELHSRKEFWLDIVKELWPKFFPFPLEQQDAHPCSLTAIFSEQWGAAYYSHLWARLVAADAFSAFVEAGLDQAEQRTTVGMRFRSTFLALGGSCHPGEVFRRFRGRDPSPNALLSSLGFKTTQRKEKRRGELAGKST